MPGFAERTPPRPLDRFIERIWANERLALGHSRERLMPTGSADLVFSLADAPLRRFADELDASPTSFRLGLVSGPSDRAAFRDTSTRTSVVGIHFRPFGLAAFVREPVDRLVGSTLSVDDLFGPLVRRVRERLGEARSLEERLDLLERELLRSLGGDLSPDPVVAHAVNAIETSPSSVRISDLYRSSGYSPGVFIERFTRTVGISPKRFARIARLQLAMRRMHDGAADSSSTVARIALASGFSDQAHLVREMRAITGLTPSTYRPVATHPNHVASAAPTGTGKIFKPRSGTSR